MNREEYNACMKPYMTGSKPKEQRQLDFCIGAKVCSGKVKSKEEASRICLLPKPPKDDKKQIVKCDVEQIVSCLVKNTDFKSANVADSLRKSIPLCVCKEEPKRRTKTQDKGEFLRQFGFEDK